VLETLEVGMAKLAEVVEKVELKGIVELGGLGGIGMVLAEAPGQSQGDTNKKDTQDLMWQ
jgi:hypothetical protein